MGYRYLIYDQVMWQNRLEILTQILPNYIRIGVFCRLVLLPLNNVLPSIELDALTD